MLSRCRNWEKQWTFYSPSALAQSMPTYLRVISISAVSWLFSGQLGWDIARGKGIDLTPRRLSVSSGTMG